MHFNILHSFRSFLTISFFLITVSSFGQDTAAYRLRFQTSFIDLPQNTDLPYRYPSMNQSFEWGSNFYELGFFGIDALGDRIFISETKPITFKRKAGNFLFKYAASLAFSKYGSELPIPLGVWTHEEYHRSVLGVAGINSKNGNWIGNRWDGTVYGVSDAAMNNLKLYEPNQLLYSYVAGVQSEIQFNEYMTIHDFYQKRSMSKNAFMLYNAWYVWDYFKFSAGAISDSVKVLAPPHESADPMQRDFAGADLTAWAYDLFNPNEPFIARDSFPDGNGVNRRIGFSDLSPEAQDFLKHQKQLSLLNFLNPAIFFVNRIRINPLTSFTVFAQYAPTHFGNAVSVYLPVKYKQFNTLLGWHNYSANSASGKGVTIGLFHFPVTPKLQADIQLTGWRQPVAFMTNHLTTGGAIKLGGSYLLNKHFAVNAAVSGKSKGWQMGSPYLSSNVSFQAGFSYRLTR